MSAQARFTDPYVSQLPNAQKRRGELLVLFSFVVGGLLCLVAVMTIILGTGIMAPWLGGAGVAMLVAPRFMLRGASIGTIAHLTNLALMTGATAVTPYIGGIYSVTMPALLLIPLWAAFLVNLRAAVLWTLACAAIVGTFAALEVLGVEFVHIIPESRRPISYGLCLLIVFVGVLLFARSYVTYRKEAGEQLQRAVELAEMLVRLKDVEHSIRRASVALSPGDEGLTDQMTRRAESGRQATGRAFQSVDAILMHYDHLEAVVEQLVMSSENIASLLEANKKIGRRLEILSLSAALEAAKVDEDAFGLVAAEIGRVTKAANTEFGRMNEVAGSFAGALGRLHALHMESEALAGDVRSRMRQSRNTFEELEQLVRQVVAAAQDMQAETDSHLLDVREIAKKAQGFSKEL